MMQENRFGDMTNHGGYSMLAPQFNGQVNFGATTSSDYCLKQIRSTDPRIDRQEILSRKDDLLENTCSWICDDEAFQMWWRSDDSSLFWLHGDAGKGKTMMMIALIEEIKKRLAASKCVVAYYFCQNTNDATNSATSTLRGLAYLLGDENPQLRQFIQTFVDHSKDRLSANLGAIHSLWDLLRRMTTAEAVDRVYLIVDALDECNNGLDELLKLLTRKDLRLPSSKVKWLVSSRNQTDIREFLEIGLGQLHSSLEVNASRVNHAVDSYIQLKVDELEYRKKYDDDLKREVANYLKERASGTFLWVSLVCKALLDPGLRRWNTLNELKKFPSGLAPLYERMLEQMRTSANGDAEECKCILRAMLIASKPLSLSELCFVANLPQTYIQDEKNIIELVEECASLLIIRNKTAFFVHQSAKDFLTTGQGSNFLDRDHDVSHVSVAVRCFDTMARALHQDMCDLKHPGVLNEDVSQSTVENSFTVETRYACLHWAYHMRSAGLQHLRDVGAHENGQLHRFLRNSFLYWLESLSLLKQIARGVNDILSIEALITAQHIQEENGLGSDSSRAHSSISSLSTVLYDYKKFLIRFRSMLELYPLQVYISGLIFAPTGSLVRQRFSGLMPSWVSLTYSSENEWGLELATLKTFRGPIGAVAFLADGTQIACLSAFGNIVLHNIENENFDQLVIEHDDDDEMPQYSDRRNSLRILTACFSSDGTYLAVSTKLHDLCLYNLHNSRVLCKFMNGRAQSHDEDEGFGQITFSHDCTTLAFVRDNSAIGIYNISSRRVKYWLRSQASPAYLSFTPCDKSLRFVVASRRVKTWDLAAGEVSPQSWLLSYEWRISGMKISPQGHTLLVVIGSRNTHILDAESNTILSTLSMPKRAYGEKEYTVYAFSPGCDLIANTNRLWNTTTGELLFQVASNPFDGAECPLVISQDRCSLISVHQDNAILWSVGSILSHMSPAVRTTTIEFLKFSPCGKYLLFKLTNGTMRIHDAANGALICCRKDLPRYYQCVFSSNGAVLLVTDKEFNPAEHYCDFQVLETATGDLLGYLRTRNHQSKVLSSSDGKTLVMEYDQQHMIIWRLDDTTRDFKSRFEWRISRSDKDLPMQISPDGQLVAFKKYLVHDQGKGFEILAIVDVIRNKERLIRIAESWLCSGMSFSSDNNLLKLHHRLATPSLHFVIDTRSGVLTNQCLHANTTWVETRCMGPKIFTKGLMQNSYTSWLSFRKQEILWIPSRNRKEDHILDSRNAVALRDTQDGLILLRFNCSDIAHMLGLSSDD